ncbi:MAG: hypothetical protein KF788_08875 [Piscinibacter sp.]|nr:hypothetical protein [Piscinibacter sp.]
MELAELQERALKAREFDAPIEGECVFRMRLPTPYEAELLAESNGYTGRRADRAAMVRTKRAMLEVAIIGWQGPRQRDVVADLEGDEAAAPLAWSAEAVPLLLDAKPEWQTLAWGQLLERIEARNGKKAAAAKNSSRASSGSDPATMRAASPASGSAD